MQVLHVLRPRVRAFVCATVQICTFTQISATETVFAESAGRLLREESVAQENIAATPIALFASRRARLHGQRWMVTRTPATRYMSEYCVGSCAQVYIHVMYARYLGSSSGQRRYRAFLCTEYRKFFERSRWGAR
mmetsp:Transcript_28193/g.55347  ORF Transcript_28193/g.55347 Transcript_28193/m.55347 type:complete len:134 (+) Transcript_28193:155-556(+)